MHWGVMGAGSIGCYVGGCLAAASETVTFVGRPALGSALAAHGLRISDRDGRDRTLAPAAFRFATSPDALAACDVILVAVKSLDTESTAHAMAPHLKPGAIVVSFQNGVRNPSLLRAALPTRIVLAGMVPFNVVRMGDHRFHRGTSGALVVEADADGRGETVAAALRAAGLAARATTDITAIQWGKLLLNLNNPINALTGLPLRTQVGQRAFRRVHAALMSEGLAALARAGITPRLGLPLPAALALGVMRLPDPVFSLVARAMLAIDPEARSSMWEDLERGRPTEIDHLNGEVVRLAQEQGMDAPCNARMMALVRRAEADRRGSPRLDAPSLTRAVLGA